MRRLGRRRAIFLGAAALLTVVAIVFGLLGETSVALAAIAALLALAIVVIIDLSARLSSIARDSQKSLEVVRAIGRQVAEQLPNTPKNRALIKRDVNRELRYQTNQIEALLQVLPRLGEHPVLPPSGGFAMDARALAELSDVIDFRSAKLVVEFGSGTSTVWAAHQLARSGGRVVSIDHDAHYADATRTQLRLQGLEATAEVRLAPLVDREGGGRWYSEPELADLTGIDVLIVDGPPGTTCPLARQPALEVLRSALNPGAVVVLDDIDREEEQTILANWMERWPEFERLDTGTSTLAVIADTTPR